MFYDHRSIDPFRRSRSIPDAPSWLPAIRAGAVSQKRLCLVWKLRTGLEGTRRRGEVSSALSLSRSYETTPGSVGRGRPRMGPRCGSAQPAVVRPDQHVDPVKARYASASSRGQGDSKEPSPRVAHQQRRSSEAVTTAISVLPATSTPTRAPTAAESRVVSVAARDTTPDAVLLGVPRVGGGAAANRASRRRPRAGTASQPRRDTGGRLLHRHLVRLAAAGQRR